ncbi:unnamed protein product [Cunninghamella echinulata]
MAQTKVIGELAIVALKARDLPNREVVGKQNPFCVFRLGEEAKKTKTDYRGGQHPVWDDQYNNYLISEADIDISEVIKVGEHDGWFQLMFKGRRAGEIYLELTFYSARPPPRRQPTRYKGHSRPQQQQQQPPPPLPNNNYPPPPSSVGRPLPPAPTSSMSTPNQYHGVGPKPYIPPPVTQAQPQKVATPHMPQTLNPTIRPSTSTGYPPTTNQHHSPYPPPPSTTVPQNSHSFYPPKTTSPPPPSVSNSNSQPLLSAPFRPGHSPQNSISGQQNNNHPHQGYPPPSHHQQQPYPPPNSQSQYGNFSTPITASASPYGAATQAPSQLGFPQPQRHSGSFNASPFPTPQQPFAAAQPPPNYPPSTGGYPQSSYPPSSYPPSNPGSGYPPPNMPGMPSQMNYPPPQQNHSHGGYPPYPPQ